MCEEEEDGLQEMRGVEGAVAVVGEMVLVEVVVMVFAAVGWAETRVMVLVVVMAGANIVDVM